MKTKKRILKAGLWAGLLLVMSCVMPMVSAVFPVLEGFAGQAYAAKIDGTVFDDTNQDGLLDPGETGISGVTITLDDSTFTTTDGAGAYIFSGVLNGTHGRYLQAVLSIPSSHWLCLSHHRW